MNRAGVLTPVTATWRQ